MMRRTTRSTRTDTLVPYTTLCRAPVAPGGRNLDAANEALIGLGRRGNVAHGRHDGHLAREAERMLIAPIGRRPEGLRARIDRILGFQASELDHAVGIGRVGPKIFDLADMIEILDAAAGDEIGRAHV